MIQCNDKNCERKFDSGKGASIHYTLKHAKTGTIKCNYKCCGKQKEFTRSELENQYQKDSVEQMEFFDKDYLVITGDVNV